MLPILLALAFIAILFVVIVAGRPDEFCLSRSMKISAPPQTIFPHINELRRWEEWSPWAKLDPNAKNSFSGPPAGVGSSMSWEGNAKIGVGQMSIIESEPGERVQFRLEFFKPMKGTSTAEFAFNTRANQTEVTWTMSGRNSFPAKIFGLFVNCDKMMATQFDKGLAQIKSLAESESVRT